MDVLGITQARYGSKRLPAKVLLKIGGSPLLEMHLNRIKQANTIGKLIVATTWEPQSQAIIDIAENCGVDWHQGPIEDVLGRFYMAALKYQPEYVVRLTSDCPVIDPTVVDEVVSAIVKSEYDYVSNGLSPTYPDGISVEAFTFQALEKAFKEARLPSEREHVTSYIWKNSTWVGSEMFKSHCIQNEEDFSKYRLTVDTKEDFDLINKLVIALGPNKPWLDYIKYIDKYDLASINSKNVRNEGYLNSIENDIEV
jgi:spore coat polysaccharide biosynthesis protein SpsF